MQAYILLLLLLSPLSASPNILKFEGTAMIITEPITVVSDEPTLKGFNFNASLIYPEVYIVGLSWTFIDFNGFTYTINNKLSVNVTRDGSVNSWMIFNLTAIFPPTIEYSFINVTIRAITDFGYSDNLNYSIYEGLSETNPLLYPTDPYILLAIGIPSLAFFIFIAIFYLKKKILQDNP